MKKPTYLTRLLIIGLLLCSPIGFTQMGWYFYGKEVGINIGMFVGTMQSCAATNVSNGLEG